MIISLKANRLNELYGAWYYAIYKLNVGKKFT